MNAFVKEMPLQFLAFIVFSSYFYLFNLLFLYLSAPIYATAEDDDDELTRVMRVLKCLNTYLNI